MLINISLSNRFGYYFCGSVAISPLNNYSNPVAIDVSKLDRQEVIGLTNAMKSKTLTIEGEGLELLVSRFESYTVVVPTSDEKIEEVKEIIEEVKEEPVQETIEEEVVEEVIQEEAPVVDTAPKVRRTSTRAKK